MIFSSAAGGQKTLAPNSLASATVAPSIFTADGSASGVPIAVLVTVYEDRSQESRLVYDCGGGMCRAVELDLATGGTNVLVLYATGIRNARLEDVTARVGSIDLPVQYAGAQGDYGGLDQINLSLPAALAGRGAVTLEVAAAGKPANAVSLQFR
jgi:uncharacterized protein (TIGR03437 family)